MDKALYDRCIANGCSPRLAETLASRKAPGSLTDREFHKANGKRLLDQFHGNEALMRSVLAQTRKHGYTPNETDQYIPSLGSFPGDPAAFVSEGLGQIKRTVEAKDMDCEGFVTNARKDREPKAKKVKVAKDIVDRRVKAMVKREPGLARKSVHELRERAADACRVKVCDLDP